MSDNLWGSGEAKPGLLSPPIIRGESERQPRLRKQLATVTEERDRLAAENEKLAKRAALLESDLDDSVATGNGWEDEAKHLAGQRDRLVEALRGLVDDEQCTLDHDGNCQTHYGDSPCSMAVARAALSALPDEVKG